jgi:hypothetical protein
LAGEVLGGATLFTTGPNPGDVFGGGEGHGCIALVVRGEAAFGGKAADVVTRALEHMKDGDGESVRRGKLLKEQISAASLADDKRGALLGGFEDSWGVVGVELFVSDVEVSRNEADFFGGVAHLLYANLYYWAHTQK